MEYAPHQQRVIEEKTELDTKARALESFIHENPQFGKVEEVEQSLLREQLKIMLKYSHLLGIRISIFQGVFAGFRIKEDPRLPDNVVVVLP